MQNARDIPPLFLSAKAIRTTESPISSLIATALANPSLISFAAGLVDPLTLPVNACATLAQKILADPVRGRAALNYDTTLGLAALREKVLSHLAGLEKKPAAAMGLTPEDMVITTGSQQALYLIGDVLLDPGDIVITANPSYFVFAGSLQSLGADVRTVPMDEEGMDVEAVGRLLEGLDKSGELGRVKFIYCTSFFQNPTGLTLSAARRPRLLEIAKRFSRDHRILILEDAAYRELLYDGPSLPSIKSFDPDNRYTILTQTFSKPFAPGLKTGYTAMPGDLLEAVVHQKGSHDFGSSHLAQQILLEAMADGTYAAHGEILRAGYRKKRDEMIAALKKHMPLQGTEGMGIGDGNGIHWTHPHGGLYVWMTLPERINTSRDGRMFGECVKAGVLYVPGEYCFHADEQGHFPENHLRLSFGHVALEKIDEGIARMAGVIRHLLAT